MLLSTQKPEEFRPHSLRSVMITALANDSGVSTKECMAASRHKTVAASATYQQRNYTSEANRLRAVGLTAGISEGVVTSRCKDVELPTKKEERGAIVTSPTESFSPQHSTVPTSPTSKSSSHQSRVPTASTTLLTQDTMDAVDKNVCALKSTLEAQKNLSDNHQRFMHLYKQVQDLKDVVIKQNEQIRHYQQKEVNELSEAFNGWCTSTTNDIKNSCVTPTSICTSSSSISTGTSTSASRSYQYKTTNSRSLSPSRKHYTTAPPKSSDLLRNHYYNTDHRPSPSRRYYGTGTTASVHTNSPQYKYQGRYNPYHRNSHHHNHNHNHKY